jgi:hypothetical protein
MFTKLIKVPQKIKTNTNNLKTNKRMKKHILSAALFAAVGAAKAPIGINTNTPKAILDVATKIPVSGTNHAGFTPPEITPEVHEQIHNSV